MTVTKKNAVKAAVTVAATKATKRAPVKQRLASANALAVALKSAQDKAVKGTPKAAAGTGKGATAAAKSKAKATQSHVAEAKRNALNLLTVSAWDYAGARQATAKALLDAEGSHAAKAAVGQAFKIGYVARIMFADTAWSDDLKAKTEALLRTPEANRKGTKLFNALAAQRSALKYLRKKIGASAVQTRTKSSPRNVEGGKGGAPVTTAVPVMPSLAATPKADNAKAGHKYVAMLGSMAMHYMNKNAKTLDLPTREFMSEFVKATAAFVDTMNKE